MRRSIVLSLAVLVLAAPVRADPALVVFMSDFGHQDDSVAICKGAMLSLSPQLHIVDLTHDVSPWAIADGARFLAGAAPSFPEGTVFVGVVDPGVGTNRRAVVARNARHQRFVVPDNGLLTLLDGLLEVRALTNEAWFAPHRSATFHGRDVFAPAAARLAAGADFGEAGPVISDWVRLELPKVTRTPGALGGEVVAVEAPYGNLVTNLPGDEAKALGPKLRVRFGRQAALVLPFVDTFGDVPRGQPLAYVDSRGRLAFAVNAGSFAARYKVTASTSLHVEAAKRR